MTAREYLEQVRELDDEIERKIRLKEKLSDLVTKRTGDLDAVTVTHTRNTHAMEDLIARITDLEAEINEDIDRLACLKHKVMTMICQIPNERQQEVLELRYLQYKSWDQVFKLMGYVPRYTFEIHAKALKMFQLVCEAEGEGVEEEQEVLDAL